MICFSVDPPSTSFQATCANPFCTTRLLSSNPTYVSHLHKSVQIPSYLPRFVQSAHVSNPLNPSYFTFFLLFRIGIEIAIYLLIIVIVVDFQLLVVGSEVLLQLRETPKQKHPLLTDNR